MWARGHQGWWAGSWATTTTGVVLPSSPHLLPEALYHVSRWGQSEKGNSQQPTWVKVCCVLKLGAKVRCVGFSVSPNHPGLIVISLVPAFSGWGELM